MARIIFIIIKITIVLGILLSLVACVLMSLWNWLVPDLFKGPKINFWQACGLFIMSKILFGGLGNKLGNKLSQHKKQYWRKKFAAKMTQMTPEQREEMEGEFKKWTENDSWMNDQGC